MDKEKLEPNRSRASLLPLMLFMMLMKLSQRRSNPDRRCATAPRLAAPGDSSSHHRSSHTVTDGIEKSNKGKLSSAWILWQQLKNAFILANLRDSGLAWADALHG